MIGGLVRLPSLIAIVHQSGPPPLPVSGRVGRALVRVSVSDEVRRGAFQLELRAGRSASDVLDRRLLQEPSIQVGSRLSIGVWSRGRSTYVLHGVVTRHELLPSTTGADRLVVTGEDLGHQMSLRQASPASEGSWDELSDLEIVQQILARYATIGIRPDVSFPVGPSVRGHRQQRKSDLEFVRQLAAEHGLEVRLRPQGPLTVAQVGTPGELDREDRDVVLSAGVVSRDAVTAERVTYQPDRAETVVTWDGSQSQSVSTPSIAGDTAVPASSHERLVRSSVLRTGEHRDPRKAGSRLLDQSAQRVGEAMLRVDGTQLGRPVRAGTKVQVRGLGWLADGWWRVLRVEHDLRHGTWTQSVQVGRDGVGATISQVAS